MQGSSGTILSDQHWVDGVHTGAIEPDQVVMLEVLDGLQLNQEVSVEADLVEVDPLDSNSSAPLLKENPHPNHCTCLIKLLVDCGRDIFILVTH